MTHSGGKPHTNIGDRGQRYEVVQVLHDGTEMVWGWSETPGGSLLNSAMLHPDSARVLVKDRQRDGAIITENVIQ